MDMTKQDEVASLRALIDKKPRSVRLMSRLACVLAEEAKQRQRNTGVTTQAWKLPENERDPIYWAHKAIQTAPDKPFGYTSLSLLHPQPDIRRENLNKAIELSDGRQSYQTILIDSLVRLLIEPREAESVRVLGSIGKAAKEHPRRRALSQSEEEKYSRICSALEDCWRSYDSSPKSFEASDVQVFAMREYRLGLFFRKMEPISTYRSRSRTHLKRVLQYLPRKHEQWFMAEFWLATMTDGDCDGCGTMGDIDRCPKQYIVGLYSTFAECFDSLLVDKLSYKTPSLLRSFLEEEYKIDSCFARTIDLGCGTGLSGLAFRECLTKLEGIDLSPEMIDKARQRGCYDKLLVGDVLDIFLEEEKQACGRDDSSSEDGDHTNEPVSLVVACDVFCYIGNLQPVFARVHKALDVDGLFVFSVELLNESDEQNAQHLEERSKSGDYQLHSCARFAHSHTYIQELARGNQDGDALFTIIGMKHAVLRKNQGNDVSGLLSIFRKS